MVAINPNESTDSDWPKMWSSSREPRPYICPVCNGKGQCYNSPSDGPAVLYEIYKTCHGCDGKGWVTV